MECMKDKKRYDILKSYVGSEDVKGALLRSINKWNNIANYGNEDTGGDNCALCMMYNKNRKETCIVSALSNSLISCNGCENTPYIKWDDHQKCEHLKYFLVKKVCCSECESLAIKERDFLQEIYNDLLMVEDRMEKEEEYYHMGQRFFSEVHPDNEYMIILDNYKKIGLLRIKSNNFKKIGAVISSWIEVKDILKITKEEFKKFDYDFLNLKPIKEEEPKK